MRNVDSTFVTAADSDTQQVVCRVSVGSVQLGVDDVQSINVTSSIGSSGSFAVGGTEASCCTMSVLTDSLPAAVAGVPIKVDIGYVVDGTTHWGDFGTYTATAEDVVKGGMFTSITAYDPFYFMSVDSGYQFPERGTAMSLRTAVSGVCSDAGITVDMTGVPNISLKMFRPNSTALRDVLSALAVASMASCTYWDGTLRFVRPATAVSGSYDADSYMTLDRENFDTVVDNVSCTITKTYAIEQSEDDGVEEHGDVETTVSYPESHSALSIAIDPEFFGGSVDCSDDETLLEYVSNDIAAIAGAAGLPVSYTGYSVELFGDPQHVCGDLIAVTSLEDEYGTYPVLSAAWKYDGGLKSTYGAVGVSEDVSASSSNSTSVGMTTKQLANAITSLKDFTFRSVTGDNAAFNSVIAEHAEIDYAQINLAQISTATIDQAWLNSLLVQGQAIAQSGTVYYLDSIHVNANSIDAGQIQVDRLYVRDSDGNYKLMQVSGGTTTWVDPADVINDGTITADHIVAGAITADKITTNNLVGTGGWINLSNGTFRYANATSGNGISWDGENLTITSEYLRNIAGAMTVGCRYGGYITIDDGDITGYNAILTTVGSGTWENFTSNLFNRAILGSTASVAVGDILSVTINSDADVSQLSVLFTNSGGSENVKTKKMVNIGGNVFRTVVNDDDTLYVRGFTATSRYIDVARPSSYEFAKGPTSEVFEFSDTSAKVNGVNVSTEGHTHTKSEITDFPTLGTVASLNTGSASGNVPKVGDNALVAGQALTVTSYGNLVSTPLFMVKTQTITKNAAASTYTDGTATATSYSGYTPIGIVGFQTDHKSALQVTSVYLEGTTIHFYVYNRTSSAYNSTAFKVDVLYAKTGVVS